MQKRFGLMISKNRFDCYDCSRSIDQGSQIVWDNLRNIRICTPCVDKLAERLGTTDGLESDAPKSTKVYWDIHMLPTKPWEIGNYDINSWPIHIQKEYVDLSRSKEQYEKGLAAAQLRLSNQQANAI